MLFCQGEIFAINKPYKMSSFGVVAFVRTRLERALGVKKLKVGHAGTLDPLATGVLILCTGKATKQIPALQDCDKEYLATLQFGAITPSYDMEYPETEHFPTEQITREGVMEVLKSFEGNISQVPPAFSACNVNGKRAYALARENKEVELSAKPIHVEKIELLAFDGEAHTAEIRVVCGKGTYIRALARDVGQALGSGAYLTRLCRTRVGSYTLDESITLDDFPQWLNNNLET